MGADQVDFAINHMAVPARRWDALLDLARALDCVGVELRNDLGRPLFDGDDAGAVKERARAVGLRIVGLSQVYPFNVWSDAVRAEVEALIADAVACGAETISLIPRNDGQGLGNGERQANLRLALREIAPMLEGTGLVALVEPLGFPTSSLRNKAEAVEAIESLGVADRFKLVHDTFHHHLAGGGPLFPEHTGIVHISGVVDPDVLVEEMLDGHRVLVDRADRLDNIAQIAALRAAGYRGVHSFEPFSAEVHALADPEAALRESIGYVRDAMKAAVA